MIQISTSKAPAAIGPYSQAIEHNGFIYVSGQLPIDPATGAFPEGGIKAQTEQSIKNLQAADMGDFGAMNEVYSEYFKAPFPARCAFAVKSLPKDAMVEIECVAAL